MCILVEADYHFNVAYIITDCKYVLHERVFPKKKKKKKKNL